MWERWRGRHKFRHMLFEHVVTPRKIFAGARSAAAPYVRPAMMARGGRGGGGFMGGGFRGRGGAAAFGGAQAAFATGPRDGGFFMHDDRTGEQAEPEAARPAELSTAGIKMLVSNLGPEVTDEDLEELFEEHGGPIKKAEIFYKQDGTSSGQGEVVFKRRADADKVLIFFLTARSRAHMLARAPCFLLSRSRLCGMSTAARPSGVSSEGETCISSCCWCWRFPPLRIFRDRWDDTHIYVCTMELMLVWAMRRGQVIVKLKGVPLDGRPLELALVGVAAAPAAQAKPAQQTFQVTLGGGGYQPGAVRGAMMGAARAQMMFAGR